MARGRAPSFHTVPFGPKPMLPTKSLTLTWPLRFSLMTGWPMRAAICRIEARLSHARRAEQQLVVACEDAVHHLRARAAGTCTARLRARVPLPARDVHSMTAARESQWELSASSMRQGPRHQCGRAGS